jgi:two-component system sensor histidine kinase PilS (NtrC family)
MPSDGQATEAAAPASRSALHVKLTWLTFFRIITVTALLGGTVVTGWGASADLVRATAPLYTLALLTYVASIAFSVLLRANRALVAVAYAQMILDAAIATGAVGLTGGSDSVFVFLYSLGIVNGSILLFRRGAVAATLLSLAGYAGLALTTGRVPTPLVAFAHGGAFVATAALSSYLAELLRRTGERLQAREGDLAAITALHEAIVQSVSTGILTADAKERITFVNRAGESILGLSGEELLGCPIGRISIPLHPGAGREEIEILNGRGQRLIIGYTVSPLVGPGGADMGTALIFRDLTRWRELEEAMKRTERLADLGELSAGLAHELRNPLASLTGAIELIRARQPDGSEDERLTGIVLREAERLNQLVSRFHEFSRPGTPVRREVDLAALLQDTLRMFSLHPAAAPVRLEEALEPAVVLGDPDQLRQVAWNLVTNAAEAAAGSAAPVVRVSCGVDPGGEAAWFSVTDSGPGISPEVAARLFKPFFTTKGKGSGLGLAIVHRIVDAHEGRVDVETAPGQGATFRVRLATPSARPAAVALPG